MERFVITGTLAVLRAGSYHLWQMQKAPERARPGGSVMLQRFEALEVNPFA
jgi:hypothetical protein